MVIYSRRRIGLRALTWLTAFSAAILSGAVSAADHLDTPRVVADPRGDIGDLFAWMGPNGRTLNLAMTLVGHSFSDRIAYAFHVDSGPRFGETTATTSIVCRFASTKEADCRVGGADRATGDASGREGLAGRQRHFRVFAGLRDDPFFNNVKGTRDAYRRAAEALREGVIRDEAGCPKFDAATSDEILGLWRRTDGGAGKDFLEGWTPATIVVSVDIEVVARGGEMLAVWAESTNANGRLDRMGRPLTANALLATLGSDELRTTLKERYNVAAPGSGAQFVSEIETGLSFYDGFDGQCGNQWLAELGAEPALRYRELARLLADDRVWVNGAATACTQFLAVELAHLNAEPALLKDCGGRTPTHDAVDVYRSLLVNGAVAGVSDGVDHDGLAHSTTIFPFLAAPSSTSAVTP